MQRRCVTLLVSLDEIQDLRSGQLRTVSETMEEQKNCGKEIFVLQRSLDHQEYLGEEVALTYQIEVALKHSSFFHANHFSRM